MYARETVLIAKYPDKVKVLLQVTVVGDAAIVAIPCEVFTDNRAWRSRRASPFKHDVRGLARERLFWLPADAGAPRGLGGYRNLAGAVEFPRKVDASVKIEKGVWQ